MWQISWPSVNGASQGNYFRPKSNKLAIFEAKMSLQKKLWQPKLQTFFLMLFWLLLDERSNNHQKL